MLPIHNLDREYIVPLDSLDLGLLGQYVQKPTNAKKLLWSKPSMDGESVYCTIKIPEDFEDEDAHIESSEDYLCHICNIDVPRVYFMQHNKSRRHQNFKKLAERALQNVLKQGNLAMYYNHTDIKPDEYYCETCSKVILLQHKRQHNKSDYHLKSIQNQKLDDMFIEAYVENRENGKSVDNRNIIEDNSSDTDWNVDSDNEDELVTKFEDVRIDKVVPKNVEISNMNAGSNRSSGSSKEMIDFQSYLKEMLVKHKLIYKLPPIEDNSIVIVTPKGHKEKISMDAFHGFKRVNNFVYCQLCWISIDKDPSQHIRTKEHVMQIIQPIDDNFIRKVTILREGWGNCVLCNLTVCSSTHVSTSPNHKKYNQANSSNKNTTPAPVEVPPQKTFCNICKIYIDTHNFQVHLNAKKHLNNLKPNEAKPNEVAIKDKATTSQNVVETNDNTYCKICKVKVPPGGMTIHNAGKPHKTKLLSNIESTLKENNYDVNNLIEVRKTLNPDLPSTSKANPSTLLPQKNSLKELTREEKVAIYKKQFAFISDTTAKCVVCDTNVPNLVGNIIEHVEGAKHKKAADSLKAARKTLNTELPSTSETLLPPNKILKEPTREEKVALYKIQFAFISDSNAECMLCNTIVPNLAGNVIEHVEGAKHKKAVELLLNQNHIVKTSTKLYYCQLCKVQFEHFIEHIRDIMDHNLKMISAGIIDKNNLKKYVYDEPLKFTAIAAAYRVTYKKLLEKNKIIQLNSSSFYCAICSVNLSRTTEIEHMLGERHKQINLVK